MEEQGGAVVVTRAGGGSPTPALTPSPLFLFLYSSTSTSPFTTLQIPLNHTENLLTFSSSEQSPDQLADFLLLIFSSEGYRPARRGGAAGLYAGTPQLEGSGARVGLLWAPVMP